jgi:hypothetical protein
MVQLLNQKEFKSQHKYSEGGLNLYQATFGFLWPVGLTLNCYEICFYIVVVQLVNQKEFKSQHNTVKAG